MNQAGGLGTAIEEADPPAPGAAGNPTIPNPARVYDALLGGKDNYAADRAVADKLAAAKPSAARECPRQPRLPGPGRQAPGSGGGHPPVPRSRHRAPLFR